MTDTSIRPPTWHSLHGRLIWPDDAGYDDARRVFNAMFDRRPALVVRCADPEDVVQGLAYARATGADVTVYGGGHGVTGSAGADGAVCLDLRGMKGIEIDPVARVARVEAGCTWGSATPLPSSTAWR
jgi:FAD/FMN-containing dehydrogenase